HGLPVEIEIEKKLGISGKFEIENEIGIERFNQLCRQSVYEYVDDWVVFSERMGFWQDYDNAYWTLTSDYIQSVWWALSEMGKKGLAHKGLGGGGARRNVEPRPLLQGISVGALLPALPHAAVQPRAGAGLSRQRARPERLHPLSTEERSEDIDPGLDDHAVDAPRQRRARGGPRRRLREGEAGGRVPDLRPGAPRGAGRGVRGRRG